MARFLPLLSFLLLSATASHAALPAQVYWDTVLPSTPMPDAIRELIRPDVMVDEKRGISVQKWPFELDAATDAEIQNNPIASLFFLEKQLHPGAKMTLQIQIIPSDAPFLPRRAADSIPFSSEKLPQILDHFSIDPTSPEAEAVKDTLHECERSTGGHVLKHCATSLESMVDFSTSVLGTHKVWAIWATVGLAGGPKQQYTVAPSGIGRMAGSEMVACHAERYPYAVFNCHATQVARTYTVKMVGADGTAVEAVAVCHDNTSWWNPKHIAFQVLKVKPGTLPVCHFSSAIVWGPSK